MKVPVEVSCILLTLLSVFSTVHGLDGHAISTNDAIEAYRKGDAILTFLDESGGRMNGTTISYTQVSRDFLFGVGAVAYDEKVWLSLKEAGINYAEMYVSWNMTETAGTALWDTMSFLHNQGFTLSGHCIVWMVGGYPDVPGADPWNLPTRIKALTYDELKKQLYDHVLQTVRAYKPFVTYWGINEPFWRYADPFHLSNAQWLEIVGLSVQAIKRADPEAEIYMNNLMGDVPSENYYPIRHTKLLMEKGIEFDSIGLELYGEGRTPGVRSDSNGNPVVSSVSRALDRFAELGKPIIITEVDATSRPSEKTQADWVRDAYTMAFSKPYVRGLSWSFPFDDPWLPKAGLFDCQQWGPYNTCLDARPRQAYYVLKNLTDSWLTKGSATTDSEGRVRFRGFAGNYTLSVEGYEPFVVHVEEGKESNFVVAMKRPQVHNQAAEMLATTGSSLKEAENASFQSLVARSQLVTARTEYETAVQAFSSYSYDEAIDHCRKSLALVESAFAEEQAYQEQRLANVERQTQEQQRQQQTAFLATVSSLIAAVVAATVLYNVRKKRSQQKDPQS